MGVQPFCKLSFRADSGRPRSLSLGGWLGSRTAFRQQAEPIHQDGIRSRPSVPALDYFGGEILATRTSDGTHFYNPIGGESGI